jgi:O-acetyl-ADP-ribose deacetylase (regulator of RNase III)
VYRAGDPSIPALLASAYRRSLEVALENGLQNIAFPAISNGIYGYPLEEAAPIALSTVCDFLVAHPQIALVRFVLYNAAAMAAFKTALHDLVRQRDSLELESA